MRAFITGLSGFVGGRLFAMLSARGTECAGLSRSAPAAHDAKRRWIPGDCADLDRLSSALKDFAPDVIVHCAMTPGHPKSAADRLETLRTGLLGTAAVVEAAMSYGKARLILAGSFLVYEPSDHPLRESDPIKPVSVRGIAKASAELLLGHWVSAGELDAVTLRIFSVYGPGEPSHRFIPTLLRSLRDDSPMALTAWPRHDFVYVDDVCNAIVQAARPDIPGGSTYNIGSGATRTNAEVVAVAEQQFGRQLRVSGQHPASPADANVWQADLTHARNQLGWVPTTAFEDGLAAMYRDLCQR